VVHQILTATYKNTFKDTYKDTYADASAHPTFEVASTHTTYIDPYRDM
jgi:hypothetical protein